MLIALVPASEVRHQDNWRAAGMAGTATNIMSMEDVFVPASHVIAVKDLADGAFPRRRYSANPYYGRPWVMYLSVLTSGVLLGTARGNGRVHGVPVDPRLHHLYQLGESG